MFLCSPSPFHRPRRSFRRLFLAISIVLVFSVGQLYVTFPGWRLAHPTTAHHLLKPSGVRTASAQYESKPFENYLRRHQGLSRAYKWPSAHSATSVLNVADMGTSTTAVELVTRPSPSNESKRADMRSQQPQKSHSQITHGVGASESHKSEATEHGVHLLSTKNGGLLLEISARSVIKQKLDIDGDLVLGSQVGEGQGKQMKYVLEAAKEHASDSPMALVPALDQMTNWTEHYRFPAHGECEEVKEKADSLPDLVFVPFEDAIMNVHLEGWEDLWVSKARYIGPKLEEPKIDFVYNWVNGSQSQLVATMRPYEVNSTLNDKEGVWLASHRTNRYREWDELRYSMRSVEKYAGTFVNRIQVLVNAFEERTHNASWVNKMQKQQPQWLRNDTRQVQVLSQEEFFGPDEKKCLPSFDSLTIENQVYNTKSETDRLFALSDDMILGRPHTASDLYSPLFGPTLAFKDNAYNTLQPPTEKDAERFGEKPFLIYTSWLLNRRFGARKRKGQAHFGHSISRSITQEAITSFPRPALRSASQRFRGETGFQLYSWYMIFHYTMERHREVLLWSYITLRSDVDDDGYLSWSERQKILSDIARGMSNDAPEVFRQRIFYRVGEFLEEAGLNRPRVNTDILWTSLDGPLIIRDLNCDSFDTEECLGPGFSIAASDARTRSPVFSPSAIFDRVARETPHCGDCLLKLVLNTRRAGLGPLLPHPVKKRQQRETVIKALMKYQYTIVQPDASFHMITDAEQVKHILVKPYVKNNKKIGQLCLNDDVVTQDPEELEALKRVISILFEGLLPEKSSFEK